MHFNKLFLFDFHTMQHLCMIIVFVLLLPHPLNAFTSVPSKHNRFNKGNSTDLLALLDIKSRIRRDPQGVLTSWNESVHFCLWQGISCGRKHRRVTSLDLSSKGLVGTVSPSIGNLTFLRSILLKDNAFQGHIPSQIGQLSRLQILDLMNNSLGGEIPTNLSRCFNLVELGLAQNNLEGHIPEEMGSLPRLQELVIQENNLSGDLTVFGNITSLQVLSATDNMFYGNIPDSFGKLQNLTYLYLGGMNISGIIPHSFYNLSSLIELSLADNQLEGSLLPELGFRLPRLEFLQLNGNHFTGQLPVSLSNLSDIKVIQMDSNEFTGKITLNGRHLTQIQYLNFAGNYLGLGEGEKDGLNFIHSLVNCSQLRVLNVGSNQLGGKLPSSVANLSSELVYFHVGWNNLSGEVPLGFGNLRNLRMLVLQYNQFTGVLPNDIGEMQSLETLSVISNGLYGTIPPSLGNLSKLSELHLGSNFFEGKIPSSLGRCKNLIALGLDDNDLHGTIPEQLFLARSLSSVLLLGNNQLEGSLPVAIGELKNLALLDISNNKMSGKIPESLSSCISLESLYMRGNFFHGRLPPSLKDMKGLQVVDLSRNNLTGSIPNYLSTMSLTSLNLSFNQLEGEVPTNGVFANASAVSLTGNDRLCGGIPELNLPKCTTKSNSRRKKAPKLTIVIVILTSLVGLVIITLLLVLFYSKWKQIKPHSEFPSDGPFLQVSYDMLLKATDGFSSSNLIGYGSFGNVYRGILEPDNVVVAVKVINLQRQAALKSFMVECNALRNIRHRNLLQIITACSSIDFQQKDFKALVYEFMPNGSLDKWLHSESADVHDVEESLSLLQRINIAIDVATAIDYLHHGCQVPIVHCDLKPSNILLDSNMTAHVGDFGLARILSQVPSANESSSFGIRGTVGYAAPEYGIGSNPSKDGDVYSFGIVLLEMMTGMRPTDKIFEEGLNLHTYAKKFLPNYVMEIVDQRLTEGDANDEASYSLETPQGADNDRNMECFASTIKTGIACSAELPQDRMNIQDAIHELQSARKILISETRSNV